MALGKRVFEDISSAITGYCIVIHSVATLTNFLSYLMIIPYLFLVVVLLLSLFFFNSDKILKYTKFTYA